MASAARRLSPQLDVFVLFSRDAADDARVAQALAKAQPVAADLFSDREALLERVATMDRHAVGVVVVCSGVAEPERTTQRLLHARDDLQVVLLADAHDRRSLGERFGQLPIRARQLELLPQATPELADRIAKITEAARERHLHRQHAMDASDVVRTLRPHSLDLTSGTVRRQMLDALPLGTMVVTGEGFVAEANAAAYQILQIEDSGRPARLADLIPQLGNRAGRLPTEELLTVNRLGRTAHLRLRASPLAGNNGAPAILIVIEDATEQEEARRLLAITRAELERRLLNDSKALLEAQRERDSIKHFIASLTHDLRSPVAAATLSTQLLLRQPQLTEGMPVKLLDRVLRNLERLERMVEDLLDLTRHDMGNKLPIEPEPMRLDTLLRDVVGDVQQLYGKRISVREPLPPVEGRWDRAGICRVIENLGSNAVKYGDPDRPAEVTLEAADQHVTICFRNYGPPIPADAQKVIFEPFYRAETPSHRHIPGWGVGLAFVRVMTESHGGSVAVSSSAEHGTVFSVRLPK
jgi:signal transduction histidine kinase